MGAKVAGHIGPDVAEDAAEHVRDDEAAHVGEDGAACAMSFAASTLVATPSGERAIVSLKVVQTVTAYDPGKGKASTQTVQQVFIHHDSNLLDVTLRVGAAPAKTAASAPAAHPRGSAVSTTQAHQQQTAHDEVVLTTTTHPWLSADHGWLPASFLFVGEAVRQADGGTATVVAIQAVPGAAAMWDLTVSRVHTFAVGAGEFVVHNNCGDSAKVSFSDEGQVQHEYKHAKDFGVTGNYNKANSQLFKDAMVKHLEDPDTIERAGTYRGQPATHFYNPNTDLNVFADSSGEFWGGWKMSPAQKWWIVMTGDLR